MIDLAELDRRARATYEMAPNPITFMVVNRAVQAQLRELQKQYGSLPGSVAENMRQWAIDASKYEQRLLLQFEQATKMAALVADNPDDWELAVAAAGEYASGLIQFFRGKPISDAAYWGTLANQLEEAAGPILERRKWVKWLGGSWARSINVGIESALDERYAAASKETSAAVAATKENLSSAAEAARKGLWGLALAGVAALGGFAWYKVIRE